MKIQDTKNTQRSRMSNWKLAAVLALCVTSVLALSWMWPDENIVSRIFRRAESEFTSKPPASASPATLLAHESKIFWPTPRELTSKPDLLVTEAPIISAPATLAKPAALLTRELKKAFGNTGAPAKDATTITLRISSRLTRPEEYSIAASGRQVIIEAHDEQGAFWGVHSLLQLLKWEGAKVTPDGYVYPGVSLQDWPESGFRSFLIQGPFVGTAEELKKNLDLLARMKIRYFALEFGPRVILDFDPSMSKVRPSDARFTKQQAKEIIDYGRSLGMEPIGYLNLLGHLEAGYQKFPYTDHGGIMIQNPESYEKFVYPILTEMLEVYGPVKYFHCGMDEAFDLFKYFSEQKMDTVGLLVQHVAAIDRFLSKKKIKMVIWHDMFLSPEMAKSFEPLGPANGGAPYNTIAALERIPKDVVINYWFYSPSYKSFPVIDYFKGKGFEVWTSPWYYPFGLVSDSASRGIPTMGTMWAVPPACFTFSPSDATTALYALASWNPGSVTTDAQSESLLAPEAVAATKRILYARPHLGLDSGSKLILIKAAQTTTPLSVEWPKEAAKTSEQHYGIPLDFSAPSSFAPMTSDRKPLENDSKPAAILINGNEKLALDGCNVTRGAGKMVLYKHPWTTTKSNMFGGEAVVSSDGEVISVAIRDSGTNADSKIPEKGFVLSAHDGGERKMYTRLKNMKTGDRISVLDGNGSWIGGCRFPVLAVKLANGNKFIINVVDSKREAGAVVLYQHGDNASSTRTGGDGIEIAVRNGVVQQVNHGKGNTAIPVDGFVLSAQNESPAAKQGGIADLSVGEKVVLTATVGDAESSVSDVLASRLWKANLNTCLKRLWFAAASEFSMAPGTTVGTLTIHYSNGSIARIITRYGFDMMSSSGQESPSSITSGKSWLVQRDAEPKQCLVYEWTNPKPSAKVEKVKFQPAMSVLLSGLEIYGVTCEVGEMNDEKNGKAL